MRTLSTGAPTQTHISICRTEYFIILARAYRHIFRQKNHPRDAQAIVSKPQHCHRAIAFSCHDTSDNAPDLKQPFPILIYVWLRFPQPFSCQVPWIAQLVASLVISAKSLRKIAFVRPIKSVRPRKLTREQYTTLWHEKNVLRLLDR